MPDGLTAAGQMEFRRRLRAWLVGAAILVVLIGLFVAFVVHSQRQEERDRLAARFVLCRELESLKAAQRVTLRERLLDSRAFLEQNPGGLPSIGINAEQLRRGIRRDERLLASLRPYPRGCGAFAHEPANLDVEVPPPPD